MLAEHISGHLEAGHFDPVRVSRILVASRIVFLDRNVKQEELVVGQP